MTCYFQVDGEEDRKLGVDLHEFSDILVERGCWQAVVSKYTIQLIISDCEVPL